MPRYNDAQLLFLLANDPQAGIPALLDTYGAMLNHIVNRILYQSPQDAEECISDVLPAAWQNLAVLQNKKRPLKGWLCLTARNKAINRWHSIQRKQTAELREDTVSDWMLEPHTSDAEDLIAMLVDALQPPDKEIFTRRYYLLETSREIGAELGMEENAVNVRLSRGRAKLKKQFLQLTKEEYAHA